MIDGPAASLTSPQSSIESDSGPVRAARRRALRLGPPLTVVLYAAGTLAGTARLAPLAVAVCCLALAAGLVLTVLLAAKNLTISHLRQRLRGGRPAAGWPTPRWPAGGPGRPP